MKKKGKAKEAKPEEPVETVEPSPTVKGVELGELKKKIKGDLITVFDSLALQLQGVCDGNLITEPRKNWIALYYRHGDDKIRIAALATTSKSITIHANTISRGVGPRVWQITDKSFDLDK